MATYNDDRNWDQEELDRARQVAKDNVVSEGASVPQAAKIRSEEVLDSQEPSPVLNGERATTENDKKAVEEQGVGAVSTTSDSNTKSSKKSQ